MEQVVLERRQPVEQVEQRVRVVRREQQVSLMPAVMVRVQMLQRVTMPWKLVIRAAMAVRVAVVQMETTHQAVQTVAVAVAVDTVAVAVVAQPPIIEAVAVAVAVVLILILPD